MFKRTLTRLKRPRHLVDGFPSNFDESSIPATFKPTPLITSKSLNEYRPSAKVIAFTAEHNIAFPSALRPLRDHRRTAIPLRVYLANRHVFSHYHMKYLSLFEHPLTDKVLHHYAHQSATRPLWCYVQGMSNADGSHAVVRNTAERMVRAAIFRALNAAGYDATGVRTDGGGRPPLRGTIRVAVTEPKAALKIEFEKFVEYLTMVVNKAAPQLQPRGYSRPYR